MPPAVLTGCAPAWAWHLGEGYVCETIDRISETPARVWAPQRLSRLATSTLAASLLLMAGGSSFLGLGGATYPPASVIQPLPKGDVVIFDKTFPPGGTDNMGTRVVGIGLPAGTTASAGESQIIAMLRSKGWHNLCAPSGDPCAAAFSPRDFLNSCSVVCEATAEALLAKLRRFGGPTVIVQFAYV